MSQQQHGGAPAGATEQIEDLVPSTTHPVGLDVGTSRLVSARRHGNDIRTTSELNAFIQVPYSKFTERTLAQNDISYYKDQDDLVIFGAATERFANMFNAECRRPMSDGLLNPRERGAMSVIESILRKVMPKARRQGEGLAFSVPAPTAGKDAELTFHEATLRRHLESLGYNAIAINEGLAVIFSELEDQNFTGVGISCGGGLCNVALAFLSIPSIMFSVPKGGDHIDAAAGAVLGEHATRMKLIKEEGLDLSQPPKDKYAEALHIYYDDLIQTLVQSLRRSISKAEQLPRSDRPLPVVLAGGTAKPKGFRERFERVLRSQPLPIEVSEVRLARDPLTATARGALIAAMYEK
jgi:hypothetical protein